MDSAGRHFSLGPVVTQLVEPGRERGSKPGVNTRAHKSPKLRFNESQVGDDLNAAKMLLGAVATRADTLLMSEPFFVAMLERFGLSVDGTVVLIGEVLAGVVPEVYLPAPGQVERPVRRPEQADPDPQFVRPEAFGADRPEASQPVVAGVEPDSPFGGRLFAGREQVVGDEPDHAFAYSRRRHANFPSQTLAYLFSAEVVHQTAF